MMIPSKPKTFKLNRLVDFFAREKIEEENLLFSCCLFDQPDVIMALR